MNYFIVALALSFLLQAVTGVCLAADFGGPLEDFVEEAHDINGVVMTALALCHAYRNRRALASSLRRGG